MLKFLVKNQKIEVLESEIIASDQIAFVPLYFLFDGDWNQFHKVVQFSQCENHYNLVLGTDGTSCLLPAELQAGTVKMSVFGYDAENTDGLRATTVPVTMHIKKSGFVDGGETPIPPTPDLYAQLLAEIATATVAASVEQTDTGATITITDKDGTTTAEITNGADGEDGQDGTDGASAYEIAVQNGFTGTEAEWLASLKGDKGDTGESGADGNDGQDGISPTATVTQTATPAQRLP